MFDTFDSFDESDTSHELTETVVLFIFDDSETCDFDASDISADFRTLAEFDESNISAESNISETRESTTYDEFDE